MKKGFLLFIMGVYSLLSLSSDELVVGITDNPPLMWMDDRGIGRGFSCDLLNNWADKNSHKLIYKEYPREKCFLLIGEGQIDIMVEVDPYEAAEYNVARGIEPVRYQWGTLLVDKGLPFHNLYDLNGYSVALIRSDRRGIVFKDLCHDLGIEVNFKNTDSIASALLLTKIGIVQGYVTDGLFASPYRSDQSFLKNTGLIFNREPVFFATSDQVDRKILESLDREMQTLTREDSYYQEINRLNYQIPMTRKENFFLRNILFPLALLLFLSLAVFVFFLNRLVKIRTRQYRESQFYLDLAQRTTRTGYWHYDEESCRYITSQQMMEILGYSQMPDNMLDTTVIEDKIVEEDRKKFSLAEKNLLIHGEPQDLIVRARGAENRILTLHIIAFIQKNSRGDREIFGTCQDITGLQLN